MWQFVQVHLVFARTIGTEHGKLYFLNAGRNVFYDFFGTPDQILNKWKNTTLPEVIFFQEGPGVRKWQFQDSGIKLINIKNIVEGKLVLENTNRHLGIEEVRQKYNHFLTDEGDLLMASSGVTWGKTAWVEKKTFTSLFEYFDYTFQT